MSRVPSAHRRMIEWTGSTRLEAPANALAVLTAMITPAVLISACGALIFSTATRLGRVIDRVQVSLDPIRRARAQSPGGRHGDRAWPLIYGQLDRQTTRARLIQRAGGVLHRARHVRGHDRRHRGDELRRAQLHLGRGGPRPPGRDVHALRERAAHHRIAPGARRDPDARWSSCRR